MSDILTPSLALGMPLLIALALVHATFQLGVSVLTLMSGHSLGFQRSLHRLLILNVSYIVGSVVMTALLLLATITTINGLGAGSSRAVWALILVASGLIGIMIVGSYYRVGKGTTLWIPRALADYLAMRAKHTRLAVEACVLGGVAVITELPFTAVIFVAVAQTTASTIGSSEQVLAIVAYAAVVNLPLAAITVLLAGGHRLSTIQRWRETNKRFFQYAAAAGLGAIVVYILIFFIRVGTAI